jgi:membrane associated rhomboid family serine protease
MMRITDTVKHLLIINVIFYVGMNFIPSLYEHLALFFPLNEKFHAWQVVSHMFMHSPFTIAHLIFNMLALWMFGSPLEQMWGQKKFLFFYFSAGLGAVFIPWAIDFYQFNSLLDQLTGAGYNSEDVLSVLNQGMYNTNWENVLGYDGLEKLNRIFRTSGVGASGAIMGLLAAFGLSFPNAKMALIFLPIPIAAKYFIPAFLAYEVFAGMFGGVTILGAQIAHFAHVGGALTGGLIALYWKRSQTKRWN